MIVAFLIQISLSCRWLQLMVLRITLGLINLDTLIRVVEALIAFNVMRVRKYITQQPYHLCVSFLVQITQKGRQSSAGLFYCFITGQMPFYFVSLQKASLLPYPVFCIRCKQTPYLAASNSRAHLHTNKHYYDQSYIICSTAMVRFSGGKCTVKLSVTDLEYTAGTVAETSHSAKQRSHIQQYTIESVEGLQNELLPEAYIRDPEDGMSTHFLGKNKHIPFLMAQAGCNTVDTTPSEIQDIRSTGIP